MALSRTRGCLLTAQTCLWLAVFLYHTTDLVTAYLPRVDPSDPSTIEWGDLPPVPSAGNQTRDDTSRPTTLADMAEGFVDLVQPQGLPFEYITTVLERVVYNQTATYYQDNWQTEMWKVMGLFVGIIVCLLFGSLYFIIMPITAFIFSCCRCCNNCGGKRVQCDSKRMGCKRVSLSLFFFSITGVICAGMAFTNVSNEFMKSSVGVFKTTADSTLGSLESYLNAANEQIDYMVSTEYGFVDQLLTDNLENIGDEIGDPVESYLLTEAGLQDVINSIKNISNTFSQMEDALVESETLRATLINQSEILESELSDVVDNLDQINQDCSTCIANVDQLTVTANFSQLPTLETQVEGVQDANSIVLNITMKIDSVLADIPGQITDQTSEAVADTLEQLNEAEQQVNASFYDISEQVSKISSSLSDAKVDLDRVWEDDVKVYAQYVYYALIGLTCTVLLVVMFNLIGLTMGTFSYKNVLPTERSRMSNAGGNVLMAGVFFTFLFAPFLMLITWTLFGMASFMTLSCEPLLTYQIFNETIDQPNVVVEGYYFGEVLLQNSSIPLTVTGILTECDNDASAYSALMLEALFDFDSINDQLDALRDEVYKIIEQISPEDLNYDFPFSDFEKDLQDLVNVTELGEIDYAQYDMVLAANITGVNLTVYSTYLMEEVSAPGYEANLTAQADELDRIQADIVVPMQMNVDQIEINLDLIQGLGIQLDTQINKALEFFAIAEETIASNATGDAVYNISLAYVNRLIGYGDQFYEKLESQVVNDFAKCKLVSTVYTDSIKSSCDYAIASVNTLWFTVGWCVFFYVPSIIFAVKLAKYFRIMDSEAPYRAPKKSKKKKKQTRRESDEEMPMDDIDATGPDNVRLVDNGRPHSMVAQQNPHYVQDEPILAYNDLGRPMAPPPAYNPGYPKGAPPSLPPIEQTMHQYPGGSGQGGTYYNGGGRPTSGYYDGASPLRVDVSSPNGGNRNSVNMYQYNAQHHQPF